MTQRDYSERLKPSYFFFTKTKPRINLVIFKSFTKIIIYIYVFFVTLVFHFSKFQVFEINHFLFRVEILCEVKCRSKEERVL